jgi:hypothetical protein
VPAEPKPGPVATPAAPVVAAPAVVPRIAARTAAAVALDSALPGEAAAPGVTIRIGALAALAAAVVVLILHPSAFVLPFPWQEAQRTAFEKQERVASYLKIDRAARTHFLLEGRYPDELAQLVGLGLLSPRDLRDPRGQPFAYLAQPMSYNLQPRGDSKEVAGMATTEGITGDLLLDPELLRPEEASKVPPLVLLD